MTASEICVGSANGETRDFYRDVLSILNANRVEYLLGGAFSLTFYTGIQRETKDIDIFVRPSDCRRTLDVLAEAGYGTELTFAHWIGKAFHGEEFVDVIFSSGNGVAKVDDGWFEHARAGKFMGVPVSLVPIEETVWSKSFVCERDRYDGADINHLLRAHGHELDWPRLLRRFGPHWRVLLSHIVLFGFVYPDERDRVPGEVVEELLGRLRRETAVPPPAGHLCQGTLLSRTQYMPDIEQWGYRDARLEEPVSMPAHQVEVWTDAGLL